MKAAEKFISTKLEARIEENTFRSLINPPSSMEDFCSNDYLGFARSPILKELINEALVKNPAFKNGSGGSRLLSGNAIYTEETEQIIATYHQAPAGLLFNSGYDANIGLLSSIPQRGDTILCDALIHASLIDGARLSHADRQKFSHNDLVDLEAKLKIAKGIIYVVVESLYSMDGDIAPLKEIAALCVHYNANLIVDEAHATGIFGTNGGGLIDELNLQDMVFARVITFGKALGTHGAIVLGSVALKNYLINFARSFIYTTAAPFHAIAGIRAAYNLLAITNQSLIKEKITYYNKLIQEIFPETVVTTGPIKTIFFNNPENTKAAAKALQQQGFDVRAIVSPTVAAGKERLRICLHSYNTKASIEGLVNAIIKLK